MSESGGGYYIIVIYKWYLDRGKDSDGTSYKW